jgi:phospholipid/cholesterol/gamma-HCH transport system substrate-binding protein
VRRALREYGTFAALIGMFAVLAVVFGAYIVVKERLQLPFQNNYTIRAEFPNTIGLAPGSGEPVTVAGVQVGQIGAASLQNGRAVVSLTIDRSKLPHVYRDATATLYPNTPLEDMQIGIGPGHPATGTLRDGEMIPVQNTTVPLQSDDFFNSLDGDTREYLTSLIDGFAQGLNGRGLDLRQFFKAIGPTSTQFRELSAAFAARQSAVRRLVHNLAVISVAVAHRDTQLGQLVEASNTALGAVASQDTALSQSIQLLPPTIRELNASLLDGATFARDATPAINALVPAFANFPKTLAQGGQLAQVAYPFLRNTLTPLVKTSVPVVQQLLVANANLIPSTPDFSHVTQVFQYFANELLYNDPSNKSYAFWLGWFTHNLSSAVSTGDSYGSGLRAVIQVACSVFQGPSTPFSQLLYLVVNSSVCPP